MDGRRQLTVDILQRIQHNVREIGADDLANASAIVGDGEAQLLLAAREVKRRVFGLILLRVQLDAFSHLAAVDSLEHFKVEEGAQHLLLLGRQQLGEPSVGGQRHDVDAVGSVGDSEELLRRHLLVPANRIDVLLTLVQTHQPSAVGILLGQIVDHARAQLRQVAVALFGGEVGGDHLADVALDVLLADAVFDLAPDAVVDPVVRLAHSFQEKSTVKTTRIIEKWKKEKIF